MCVARTKRHTSQGVTTPLTAGVSARAVPHLAPVVSCWRLAGNGRVFYRRPLGYAIFSCHRRRRLRRRCCRIRHSQKWAIFWNARDGYQCSNRPSRKHLFRSRFSASLCRTVCSHDLRAEPRPVGRHRGKVTANLAATHCRATVSSLRGSTGTASCRHSMPEPPLSPHHTTGTIVVPGLPLQGWQPLILPRAEKILHRSDYDREITTVHGLAWTSLLNDTGAGLCISSHVRDIMKSFHWLPIAYQNRFNLCVHMHGVHIRTSSSYLTNVYNNTDLVIARISSASFRNDHRIRYPLHHYTILRQSFVCCWTTRVERSARRYKKH